MGHGHENEMFLKCIESFFICFLLLCYGHPHLASGDNTLLVCISKGKSLKHNKKHNGFSFYLVSVKDTFSPGNQGHWCHVCTTGTILVFTGQNLGEYLEGLEVRLNSVPFWSPGREFCYRKQSVMIICCRECTHWLLRTDPRLLIMHIRAKYFSPFIVTLWLT